MRLVAATDADRAFVARVWRAVAPRYEPLLPGAFEAEARAVERQGLSSRYETLLLDGADGPVGFAGLATLTPRHAYLAQLYLLPERQRVGHGSEALRLLEGRVPVTTEALVLHVHRDAGWARRFYEKNGYGLVAADEDGSRAWAGGLLAGWTPASTLLLGRALR
ncbi:GNAT family N-acetyltransferase [Vulgatibacter sp.]|uniref:GNAT family N-acetyltransferase n=1 Tax=Vulgatibacter sp. TaxID=1971226 RepID=UPI003561C809